MQGDQSSSHGSDVQVEVSICTQLHQEPGESWVLWVVIMQMNYHLDISFHPSMLYRAATLLSHVQGNWALSEKVGRLQGTIQSMAREPREFRVIGGSEAVCVGGGGLVLRRT